MNRKKLLLLFIVLSLIFFSVYINKYQQLVNEGSYLADEHCIKINPLIIDRKNKYKEQYNLMIASASAPRFCSQECTRKGNWGASGSLGLKK